jgi:probable F420-dependent oxidoreductase
MAEAAPGRFALGLGASSEVIVRNWNAVEYDDPYHRVRDTLRFLRAALGGEKVSADFGTFAVEGFRLSRPVPPPPIYLAALRRGMLRLAGREADGVVLNWLSAGDVATSLAEVGPGKEVVARIFVVPTDDAAVARQVGRRMVTAYLNVPAYAEFQKWLGRGALLQPMWDAWAAGDRRAALDAVPDQVVDDLIVHGTAPACREHILRYVDAGVTVPALAVVPVVDLAEAVAALAPR